YAEALSPAIGQKSNVAGSPIRSQQARIGPTSYVTAPGIPLPSGSMRYGLATSLLLVAIAAPAVAQEIRPTLRKIKETGAIQLGHPEASRPFSFLGKEGKPAGSWVDVRLRVAAAMRESLKLPELKISWVPVTPADRVAKLVKGTIDLECGSTTITFGRMEQVAFSHMIFVD